MLRQEVVDNDLGGVPTAQVKAVLRRLRDDPDAGKPLGGSLEGCRSIALQGSENRVVYQQIEVGGRAVVEVLAIEGGRDSAAYDKAEQRM